MERVTCKCKCCSVVTEKKLKMPQQIRGKSGHLGYPIGPKNFVKDIKFLFPVKFCQIPFNGFKEEVRRLNCLTQSEAKRNLGFTINRKNRNLVEDIEILFPVKFC